MSEELTLVTLFAGLPYLRLGAGDWVQLRGAGARGGRLLRGHGGGVPGEL